MTERYDHLEWREVLRRLHSELGIFDIYTARRRAHDGVEGDFVLLDAPDWVTIVPLVKDDASFLMVRQFRHGLGRVTLEFPAGVVQRDEPARDAAARELLEETGCTAGELVEIGAVNPNPAFMMNTLHTFVARDLTRIGEQRLDELEYVDVEEMPVDQVLTDMGTGPFANGIMMITLGWYERWVKRNR